MIKKVDLSASIPKIAEIFERRYGPNVAVGWDGFHDFPIQSAVVAKPDPIHERWLSGEIASLEAIDELVESGMDFKEADKLVTTWIHNV
jgi:hypothetical protein